MFCLKDYNCERLLVKNPKLLFSLALDFLLIYQFEIVDQ